MKILEGKYKKKDEMVAYFKENPDLFPSLIASSLNFTNSLSWRSTLLVGHLMLNNDSRIFPFVDQYIEVLPNAAEGHQRQILVILDKMKIAESQEGSLFNYCLSIWEAIHKIPSTRIRAFWMMEKIAQKHIELKEELIYFVTPYFTETLSPGIKSYLVKNYYK